RSPARRCAGQKRDARRAARTVPPQRAHVLSNGPSRRAALSAASFSGFSARHWRVRETVQLLHHEWRPQRILGFSRNALVERSRSQRRHRLFVITLGSPVSLELVSSSTREPV